MYAPATAQVSPRSKTPVVHNIDELRYLDCDDTTGIVHFQAESQSQPGVLHTVGLDTTSGATMCTCKAAECGRRCWHREVAPFAFVASPAMQEVRWLTTERLARYTAKYELVVSTYRRRAGRVLPSDMLNLICARAEHHRRTAQAAPALLAVADQRAA